MKKREVVMTAEAQSDLVKIYDWISGMASPSIAIGYIERLEYFCKNMDLASERGHLRDDIRPNLRIVGFEKNITIAFRVAETRVEILRLFYGGQNWESDL